MLCPKCQNQNTKVIDSRAIENGKSIRRRRKCEECNYRYSTVEKIELREIIVKKSNGSSEIYSREKLERGVWLSCGKLNLTKENIDKMIVKLEEKWFLEKEITTKRIGADLMEALKNLHEIAYIRFASVYREFRDVEDFQNEIQKIFKKK